MNKDYGPTTTQRRPVLRSSAPNIVLGIGIQLARRWLFIDPKKKAATILACVTILSAVGSFITFDENVYIIQKHSVFNQYGVKLGWMWTCFVVGPFIWFASRAHYRFNRVLQWTSRCDLSIRYSRSQCKEKGGVWIPGFDISGHCFLLIYSMLIMAEEAHAFREWNQVVHRDDDSGVVMRERQEKRVKLAQYFIVGMLVLNIIWIKQLTISVLYYHIMIDKIAGAIVAILCWYITYHILYPAGFLQQPIHRVKSTNLQR
ncbi:unnamed protein product [Nippostrongylus brasiliensis]|uniref:FIT family protein (inferred by orthology to a C. elegans protein) n=1 Tax=Nippostrongylus brasiliensis TaxID=27835 RepID=A0A158R311_NIPBR|nr:unnamed protein product [Nippostrongylus brasiliensis]